MTPTLARVEAHVFRTPIKDPVRTSFGIMTERAAVFVRVEDSDGARGWGEIWCNFPNAAADLCTRLRPARRLLPGMADAATGRRRVSRIGNVGYRTSWTLRNLPAGEYRWRIQAIDAALAPSAFAPGPQTFTVSAPITPPIVQPKPWHDWLVGNPLPSAVDFLGVASTGSSRIVVGRRGQILQSRRPGLGLARSLQRLFLRHRDRTTVHHHRRIVQIHPSHQHPKHFRGRTLHRVSVHAYRQCTA